MIHSYVVDDFEGFKEECTALIEFEEKKGNYKLAGKMKATLESQAESNKDLRKDSASLNLIPLISKRNNSSESNLNITDLIEIKKPILKTSLVLNNNILSEIDTIINQWRRTKDLQKYNLTPQNTILFHGPPGTGKTLTAYQIANELNLNIAYVNFGKLVSSYLGKSGENIWEIFEYTKKNKCVLLLDELDAIGKKRDDSQELGELKRIVISLLQSIDNFGENSILIACTNHAHLLDSALWRRFDNNVEFTNPYQSERRVLFKNRVKELNLEIESYWLDLLSEISANLSSANIVMAVDNGIRRWVVEDEGIKKFHHFIVEEIIKFNDMNNLEMSLKINIAEKLKANSKVYTFEYLSNILSIPKSTLHKKIASNTI